MLKATTLRLEARVYKEIDKYAQIEYLDLSAFLRKLVMKSLENYRLEKSLKDFETGTKSISEIANENNLTIYEILDELEKKNVYSPLTSKDLKLGISTGLFK
ncbi:MAG: hypothetical protein V1824_02505 [archaeon]